MMLLVTLGLLAAPALSAIATERPERPEPSSYTVTVPTDVTGTPPDGSTVGDMSALPSGDDSGLVVEAGRDTSFRARKTSSRQTEGRSEVYPVIIGVSLVVVAISMVIGFNAYRARRRCELNLPFDVPQEACDQEAAEPRASGTALKMNPLLLNASVMSECTREANGLSPGGSSADSSMDTTQFYANSSFAEQLKWDELEMSFASPYRIETEHKTHNSSMLQRMCLDDDMDYTDMCRPLSSTDSHGSTSPSDV